jgi:hypothetical protein
LSIIALCPLAKSLNLWLQSTSSSSWQRRCRTSTIIVSSPLLSWGFCRPFRHELDQGAQAERTRVGGGSTLFDASRSLLLPTVGRCGSWMKAPNTNCPYRSDLAPSAFAHAKIVLSSFQTFCLCTEHAIIKLTSNNALGDLWLWLSSSEEPDCRSALAVNTSLQFRPLSSLFLEHSPTARRVPPCWQFVSRDPTLQAGWDQAVHPGRRAHLRGAGTAVC